MKKVLVTGGDGFIGSHLVNHLIKLGIEVLVFDKSIYKHKFPKRAILIEGDILSNKLIHECLKQVDTCFHLAALSSLSACDKDWIFSHENNVLSFNGLLDLLRQIDHPVKLVYASSCAVYGQTNTLPFKESEKVTPVSVYGADKLSNEIYAEVMSHTYGIDTVGLRLFNVYGPGQCASNPYSGVITCFKKAIDTLQPIKIFGNGHQTRDFIYVDDVVEAFTKAGNSTQKSGVFNVCSGHSISILDLAKLMMNLSQEHIPIIHEPPRAGELYHTTGDGSLAKEKLNFHASTTLELGLASMLQKTPSNRIR